MVHPKFSGEPEELFIMQEAIDKKDVKMITKSFQTLKDAWSYLDGKFSRADVAAVKIISEFGSFNLNQSKSNDHEKFMRLYEKFRNLATYLSENGQLVALSSLTKVNIIVAMMPGEIKTKFVEFKSSNFELSGYCLRNGFMEHQVKISRECVVAMNSATSDSGKS